jgi:hypothetical protein
VAWIPGGATVSATIEIPKPAAKPTAVVDRIYPTSAVLPENQLKFYIHFSAPMARGFAYDQVSLLEESGARVDNPFLELGEELWDPEGRRFTLFIDPGRIKRGLVSQEELGAALHEGRRYTLVIHRNWKDAAGNPLAAEFRKPFAVGRADRKALEVSAWKASEPVTGTKTPLTLAFPEPMDHAILERDIEVLDGNGTPVTGSVSVGPEERSWVFTPDLSWKTGGHSLRLGSAIADLAGNMIGRAFEIDVFDKVEDGSRPATHTLPFSVK